jgi:NAD(P)-dependent dehydrogenase (short-subunit alcohol dehydrogenase family)
MWIKGGRVRLQGKIAVVTGAANGIGDATVRLFAAEGAHVYVTDCDGAAAEAVAADIITAGGSACAVSVDVTRGQDVLALMRTIEKAHGRIDALVNNAGLNILADFRNMSDADWVRLREVNLDGVMRIARDAFPLLRASGKGSLVNVASIMGNRGLRPLAAYSATKGAVAALTRGLAIEYAPFNIRVNSLAPGYVETKLTQRALKLPQFRQALIDKTPMKRFGTCEEMAKASLFLVSDDASYITGAELAVDGGMSASL